MNRIGRLIVAALLGCACLPAGAGAASIEGQYAIPRVDSAVLEADIDPEGEPTSCHAQYVSEADFQVSGYAAATTVPCSPEDLGAGNAVVTATASLPSLNFDTTYHYRFLAGALEGGDQTFATFGLNPFGGFEAFSFQALDEAGEPAASAGSHPDRLNTIITLSATEVRGLTSPAGVVKSIFTDLPAGLAGSAAAVPPCPPRLAEAQRCSGNSQVGRMWIATGGNPSNGPAPLYSVTPPRGKSARFLAVVNLSTAAFIDAGVRTGGDYGITAGSHNITELAYPWGVRVEMWGVPGSPLHDSKRTCGGGSPGCESTAPEAAFLSMPTACGGPLWARSRADAYGRPGLFSERSYEMPAITGCNALQFEPTIEARPTTNVADSPSGLHVDLHVPQPPAPQPQATSTLTCDAGRWEGAPNEFSFRWLRNGTPIPGAEGPTYTQSAADAASILQCEVEASNGAGGPGLAAGQAFLARPIPSPDLPRIKFDESAVTISGSVDSSGGTLTCDKGEWVGATDMYSYRWFKDGALVPGETGGTYAIAAGEAPLSVQCEVIGSRGGTASVAFSEAFRSEPAPEPAPPSPIAMPSLSLEGGPGLATANLRDAVVKLPPGLTVNPSSAAGLEGCDPDEFGLTTPVGTSPIHTTPAPARCPDAAKIGSVEVDTPLLDHPLPGAVYLAEPYQNPFRSLIAIYIAVHDPISGVVLKLAGHVELGPDGQLTTTFDENPQLPFAHFKLDFFAGPRAALRTPSVCGRYETTSVLTPWSAPESGPPATPRDSYEISQAPGGGSCPTNAAAQPNSPSFQAGTESPLAGAFSPFVLNLRRDDGSQTFKSLDVSLPPGLLGKLAGTAYCPDSALAGAAARSGAEERASASCPAASELGTVNVSAGAGPAPYAVQGRAYLAGPYRGAPLSLAIVTPAVAGPYDLGTVVVRSALMVDPSTTQITVKSDSIPAQLKGIPIDVRSIAVKIDRSDFTVNPTSCEAMSVTGAVMTNHGGTAPLSNRFQVGECAKLGFKPKLGLRLFGASRRGGSPRLRATLSMPPSGANIAYAQVALPHSEFLNQAHIRTICTRVQYAAGDGHGTSCPPGSVYGYARAWSPLIDQPLQGPVFLRSSSNPLPDLVAALRGQIDVDLVGRIDSHKGGIRNTFDVVPDARVSRFMLTMKGGKKGLLENSTNICRGVHRATVKFIGQNGKVANLRPKMRAKCPRKARRKKSGHRRGGGKRGGQDGKVKGR